jgi:hypothetical protein
MKIDEKAEDLASEEKSESEVSKKKKYVRNPGVKKRVWRPMIKGHYAREIQKRRKIGFEIDKITQEILALKKDPTVNQDEILTKIGKVIELRKSDTFRNDFPTFNSYYKFLTNKELELTFTELKEIVGM